MHPESRDTGVHGALILSRPPLPGQAVALNTSKAKKAKRRLQSPRRRASTQRFPSLSARAPTLSGLRFRASIGLDGSPFTSQQSRVRERGRIGRLSIGDHRSMSYGPRQVEGARRGHAGGGVDCGVGGARLGHRPGGTAGKGKQRRMAAWVRPDRGLPGYVGRDGARGRGDDDDDDRPAATPARADQRPETRAWFSVSEAPASSRPPIDPVKSPGRMPTLLAAGRRS